MSLTLTTATVDNSLVDIIIDFTSSGGVPITNHSYYGLHVYVNGQQKKIRSITRIGNLELQIKMYDSIYQYDQVTINLDAVNNISNDNGEFATPVTQFQVSNPVAFRDPAKYWQDHPRQSDVRLYQPADLTTFLKNLDQADNRSALGDKQVIVVPPIDFALGDHTLTLYDKVCIDGYGRKLSRITSIAQIPQKGCIVHPVSNNSISRLTIEAVGDNEDFGNTPSTVYQACVGTRQANDADQAGLCSNFLIEDVDLIGKDTDCIYFVTTAIVSGIIRNASAFSRWDTFVMDTDVTSLIKAYVTSFRSNPPRYVYILDGDPQGPVKYVSDSQGPILTSGRFEMYGGDVQCGPDGKLSNKGSGSGSTNGYLLLQGVLFDVTGTAAQDVYQSGGTVIAVGCRKKSGAAITTSGTVTQ